ncbi:MAG: hypothetical protein ABIJ09_09315 [Pseudomonadota bacterium]
MAGAERTGLPPVLIVGDIGLLLEMELSEHGFACELADTGTEAAQVLTQRALPLVIVSTSLMDMTGVDFTRSLLHHVPSTRVVLYGSGISEPDQQSLATTGRVFCVPATMSGQELGEKLADMARRGDLTRGATMPSGAAAAPQVPDAAPPPAPIHLPAEGGASAELEDLRRRVREAEGALQQNQAETEKLRAENEAARQHVEQQNRQLADDQHKLEDAQRYVTDVNRQLEEGRQHLAGLEQQISELQQEVVLERETAKRAEQRVLELEQLAEDDSASTDMFKTRISGLEEMLGETRRQVQSLEGERTTARTEAEELRARVAEITTQKAKLEQKQSDLTFDRDEARSEAQQLRSRVSELDDAVEAMRAQLAERESMHEELALQHQSLLIERDGIQAQLDLAAQARDAVAEQVQALGDQLAAVSDERDAAVAQASDLEGELNLLRETQDEITSMQQQKMQTAADDEARRNEIVRLNEDLQKRLQELAERDARIATLQRDLESADSGAEDFSVVDEEELGKELERRTAQFHSMVDALSPLGWGLEKAIEHVEMLGEDTSEVHLRQMRVLFNVIKRIADEVEAMKASDRARAAHAETTPS